MADCDRDIFAAFTGPDGGITSISNTAEQGRTTETQLAGFNFVFLADYSLKTGVKIHTTNINLINSMNSIY